MKSVILVGQRCAGKTSVGMELAKLLRVPFVDYDEIFEKRYGTTITGFVEDHGGWEKFREYETGIITEVVDQFRDERIVFAPGGGAVAHEYQGYREQNVGALRGFGEVVYLLPEEDIEKSAEILFAQHSTALC